jgi:hypothetical protein
MNEKSLNVFVPVELIKAVSLYCIDKDISRKQAIIEILYNSKELKKYLEKENESKK